MNFDYISSGRRGFGPKVARAYESAKEAAFGSRRAIQRGWTVPPTLGERAVAKAQQLRPVAARMGRSRAVRWAGVAVAAYVGYKVIQRLREADLRRRVVLITGGSRGLGLLLARAFAREGCRVALCARHEESLQRARRDLIHRGATDVFIQACDVTDRDQVRALVQGVTEHYGRIDVLVNNAGMMEVGPLDVFVAQDFGKALDVMFWGVLHPTLSVLPQMRARGEGRIVNITSIGGMVSVPHLLPYNCAKFAAVGLSQGLHAELARDGIKVTTIVPGTMRIGSHLNARFLGDSEHEYGWFALGSTAPFVSVSGERAARQIVRATKRGEPLRIIGLPAKILERVNGLFPSTMARVMSVIDRNLHRVTSGSDMRDERGAAAAEKIHSSLFRILTRRGYWAAEQTNQFSNGDGAD